MSVKKSVLVGIGRDSGAGCVGGGLDNMDRGVRGGMARCWC